MELSNYLSVKDAYAGHGSKTWKEEPSSARDKCEKSHKFLDHILTYSSFPAVSALTRPVSSASTDCWFAVRLVFILITCPYLGYTDLIFAHSASVKSPQTSASSSTDKRLALLFLYPPFTKKQTLKN